MEKISSHYMRLFKKFLFFVIISVFFSVLLASEKVNFVTFGNYNSILKVQISGNNILFNSVNGLITFNDTTGEWTYDWKSNSNSLYCGKPNYHLYERLWPKWLKMSTYPTIVAVDDEMNTGYMLVAHVNEGGIGEGYEFADYSTKKGYKFKDEQYTCFAVKGNTVWIGSCIGIFKLDLKLNTLEKYLTFPALPNPVGIARYQDMIYFTDRNYGIFGINRKTGKYKEVCSNFNVDVNNPMRFTVMGQQGDKFYAISTGYTCNNSLEKLSGIYLHIYDMNKKELKSIPTESEYVDKMFVDGNDIVFYGSYQHDEEGEEPTYSGGILLYNLKNKTLSNLANVPVKVLWKVENGYKTMNYSYEYDSTRYVEGFLDLKKHVYKPLKLTCIKYERPSSSKIPTRTKQQQLDDVAKSFGVTITADIECEEILCSEQKPCNDDVHKRVASGYYQYQKSAKMQIPNYAKIMELLKVKVKTIKVSTEEVETTDYQAAE